MTPLITYIRLAALVTPFAVATSLTPGPNNLMLASSGASYGFRRTLGHLEGVVAGFTLMMLVVGFAVSRAIAEVAVLAPVIRAISIVYLLYIAWRIATADIDVGDVGTGKPFTFVQAATFQWVNPKAWSMIIGAFAAFTSAHLNPAGQVVVITGVFAVAGVLCMSLWAGTGHVLSNFLRNPHQRRIANYLMGGLLLVSIVPIAMDAL